MTIKQFVRTKSFIYISLYIAGTWLIDLILKSYGIHHAYRFLATSISLNIYLMIAILRLFVMINKDKHET